MKRIIRGFHNIVRPEQGSVATIGNFDGVHLGHQAVLTQLALKGDILNLPAIAVTFEPQANEFFAPDKAPARLTRFREKVEALRSYSIEQLCVLNFNKKLAQMSAQQFVQQLLVEGLNVKYLVVGDDFRFGQHRQGDFTFLEQAGKRYGFQVANMHTFAVEQKRVSSTRIRQALASGNLMLAQTLLGHPYRMSGRVAHGHKRGRTLGFPTANIHLHRCKVPFTGVYAIQLFGIDNEPFNGVANIGLRPTIGDQHKPLLEVHLFDFNQDIYGHYVQVNFIEKIRDEQRFESLSALQDQIQNDCAQAKAFFSREFSNEGQIYSNNEL